MPPSDQPRPALLALLERLERHLSIPRMFATLGVAIFLIAWNRGIALLYALFALWIGVALLSILGAYWMLRRATARFDFPDEAVVGDTLVVRISVSAVVRPHRRLLVSLAAPYSFAPKQSLFLSECGNGMERIQHVSVMRRGVFEMGDVTVNCAYPLGLFTLARRWQGSANRITVYPRTYPVLEFSPPAGSHRNSGELDRPAPSIGQELFREVREYRSGDNPRHIHWRSSARHGHLIVKQFDAIAAGETWIVLDLNPQNHAGDGADHSFERALEIAASLATHLIRSGQRCGIAGGLKSDGTPQLCILPDAGATHLKSIMYALAAVKADCSVEYETVLSAMSAHYRRQQQWILFNHAGRINAPDFLRRDAPPVWFRFDTASFESASEAPDEVARPPGRFVNGYSVARNTDWEGLFR